MSEPEHDPDVQEEQMDTSSDDDSDSSSDDALTAQNISNAQKEIEQNPYAYDSHVLLIESLRKQGELSEFRKAREHMSQLFPLTEKLWLEWLEDEKKVAAEDQVDIIALFERAVDDYLSVEIWLEYAQHQMGGISAPGGIEEVRKVFERALAQAGLHVSKGGLLWDAYREFEIAILAGLQAPPGATLTSQQQEQQQAQTQRLKKLYQRQLSVPLEGMEQTWEELVSWLENEQDIDEQIRESYRKANDRLKALIPFEDDLARADPPRSAEYSKYIEHETKSGDPSRIQCLYERTVVENCLDAQLWIKYISYLDDVLQIESQTIKICERALRNCPWAVALWDKYSKLLERNGNDHDKIKKTYEQALYGNNFQRQTDHLQLWTSYCDYMRRRVVWDQDHVQELEDLRQTFENAVDFIGQKTRGMGDPDCTLWLYQARIEAKFCKNMDKARELWNSAIKCNVHFSQAAWWLEYYQLERAFGDHKHARRVLERALNQVTDWPDNIAQTLINFEREEGTLEQLEKALEKAEMHQKKQRERQEAEVAQAKLKEKKQGWKQKQNRPEQNFQKDNRRPPPQEKAGGKAGMRAEGGARGGARSSNAGARENGSQGIKAGTEEGGAGDAAQGNVVDTGGAIVGGAKGNRAEMVRKQQELMKARAETLKQKEENPSSAATPPPAPVTTDQEGFKVPAAPKAAPVQPPPAVRKRSAPPPGYCPDDGGGASTDQGEGGAFTDQAEGGASTSEPVSKKSRMDLLSNSSQAEGDEDKNERSVFVSNLDYKVDEKTLHTAFSVYGEVKDIRVARDQRTKRSRGFGFVEFTSQAAAEKAKTEDRRALNGRPMYISDCDPQNRKQFQYASGREQNKLFIRGIPATTTTEALERLFGQHGKLIDVRIPTYHNGTFKGIAFVEYEAQEDASKAVLKTDGIEIGNAKISVAISNPPERRKPLKEQLQKKEDEAMMKFALGQGKKENTSRGGKAHTMLAFQPRSLKTKDASSAATSKSSVSGNQSTDPATDSEIGHKTGMSNTEFRKMFLSK